MSWRMLRIVSGVMLGFTVGLIITGKIPGWPLVITMSILAFSIIVITIIKYKKEREKDK